MLLTNIVLQIKPDLRRPVCSELLLGFD